MARYPYLAAGVGKCIGQEEVAEKPCLSHGRPWGITPARCPTHSASEPKTDPSRSHQALLASSSSLTNVQYHCAARR